MKLLRGSLIFFALVVLQALYVRQNPAILFKVPKIGFILHTIATGLPPPPFFTLAPFEPQEMRQWTRDGDVMVTTGAKCGTNVLLLMTHLIRVKGDHESFPYRDVNLETPFVSMLHKPGQTWQDMKELLNTTVLPNGTLLKTYWDNPAFPFRAFKCHEYPKDENIPGGVFDVAAFPKVKFLVSMRAYEDVVGSFTPFFRNHREDFREMWGGFPPLMDDPSDVISMTASDGALTNMYFGYVQAWWKHRHEPNVLLVHYNEIVNTPAALVRKVARFYGVDLTDEQVEKIVGLIHISKMKQMDSFDYWLWGNKDFLNGTGYVMKSRSLVRKGAIGDAVNIFTPSQLQTIKANFETGIKDASLREFLQTGVLPPPPAAAPAETAAPAEN